MGFGAHLVSNYKLENSFYLYCRILLNYFGEVILFIGFCVIVSASAAGGALTPAASEKLLKLEGDGGPCGGFGVAARIGFSLVR